MTRADGSLEWSNVFPLPRQYSDFTLQRSHAAFDISLVNISRVKSVRPNAASMTAFTCSSPKPYPKQAKRLIGVAPCTQASSGKRTTALSMVETWCHSPSCAVGAP